MKKRNKIGLGIVCGILFLVLVGPFLVPVPPLEHVQTRQALASEGSQFLLVDGLEVHYQAAGGGPPVFLLLHGFGASTFSWREVMEPLAEWGRAIAYDRPAFGLTERPLVWEGGSPYSTRAQVDLVVDLMDELDVEQAVLVGHSAGGTVALAAALEYPDRVAALVLVDPAVYIGGGTPALVRPLLNTPQMDHLGPLIARRISTGGDEFLERAWHDPAKITPDVYAGYRKPLQAPHWDQALWELTKASSRPNLAERLDEIRMPTLVVTGDDDQVVPTEEGIRLAGEIPGASLVVFEDCGHVPQEECPEQFLTAVHNFMLELEQESGFDREAENLSKVN